MALGQVRRAIKRPYGTKTVPSVATGVPPAYDLDYNSFSYLGVPLFHFRGDWDRSVATINFVKKESGHSPQEARPGDRVKTWKNAYLPAGEGDAFVATDASGDNFFGVQGYPTLVERHYNGRAFRGLEFTGTEYLQINGGSVANSYGLPSPMFSTGGASITGNQGASFLFVIDQNETPDGPPHQSNPLANGIQALLTSRQPTPTNFIPNVFPPSYTWPPTEDYGVQYFRNGNQKDDIVAPGTYLQSYGPDATLRWTNVFQPHGIPPVLPPDQVSPQPYGGSWVEWQTIGPFRLRNTSSGFQVILLEYNNQRKKKYTATQTQHERDYVGPSVSIYGMSPVSGAFWPGTFPTGGAAPATDLAIRLSGQRPVLRDWPLFDRKNAFLGGMPPCRSTYPVVNVFGNGFRGVIYETLMIEGVLSETDKNHLSRQLQRKYSAPLGL